MRHRLTLLSRSFVAEQHRSGQQDRCVGVQLLVTVLWQLKPLLIWRFGLTGVGRVASAASSSPGSLRITQSTNPIPNGPVTPRTCRNSVSSVDVDAVLPMPTMPRLPAAVTAPASRPPATPPIEALTIGTRRPMPRDHGVDNTTVSYADDATGTATVRMITESSMAFKACRCGGIVR